MKRVYEQLADELVAGGLRATFGLMSEDTAGLIVDLDRQGVDYYNTSHENVAVGMADGYAWAIGQPAVAIIGRGPGLTNAMTAMTTAARAGRPVLIISGATSITARPPTADGKRLDQGTVAGALGIDYHEATTPAAALPALRAGLAAVRAGRTAHVAIPPSVLDDAAPDGPAGAETPVASAAPVARAAVAPSDDDVAALAAALAGSRLPLLLAGRGAATPAAVADLTALAERTGALLGTTLAVRSLFRGHAHDVGVVGGFATQTGAEVLRDVDCVLAFGASLNVWTRGHGHLYPDARLIHVDQDPGAIGLHGAVDRGVVADAPATASALRRRLDADGPAPARTLPPGVVERLADPVIFADTDESGPEGADPRALSLALDRLLPPERMVVCDAGHFWGFTAMGIAVREPGHFHWTSAFSAVGMGLGSALGAAVARPGLPVVAAVGDGGLQMTLGDLLTAARYGLRVIVVVYNDAAYGAERHYLDAHGLPHELSQFPIADFAAIAAGAGIPSARVDSVADLERHAELLQRIDGPVLLDLRVNPAIRAQWLADMGAARSREFAAAKGTGR